MLQSKKNGLNDFEIFGGMEPPFTGSNIVFPELTDSLFSSNIYACVLTPHRNGKKGVLTFT